MAATTEFESMWAGADETWGERGPVYSRKEKSLGELARRFLFLCGRLHNAEINLQQCAQDLDVERRRIYDIINILEAFNVVQRLGKNTYLWRGIQELIFFVANLDVSLRSTRTPLHPALPLPALYRPSRAGSPRSRDTGDVDRRRRGAWIREREGFKFES